MNIDLLRALADGTALPEQYLGAALVIASCLLAVAYVLLPLRKD